MEVTNYKCDNCGQTTVSDSYNQPEGWWHIGKQDKSTKEGEFWHSSKDICNACADKTGLKAILDKMGK